MPARRQPSPATTSSTDPPGTARSAAHERGDRAARRRTASPRPSAPAAPRSPAIARSRGPATPTSPTRSSSWGWCWRRAIACARRRAASARRCASSRGTVARSGHRAADRPGAHGAGRHRSDAGRLRRRRSRLPHRARRDPRRFGPRDRYLAGVLNDLGVLRKAQGRYDEALAFYRRALPLVPARRSARARDAGPQPGRHRARPRQLRRAEPHARRSVAAADRAGRGVAIRGRRRRRRAGRDRRGARAPGRGGQALRRALAVFRRVLGPTSLEVGLNLACLAAVEQRRRPAGARPSLYRRALADPGTRCSAATTPTSP